MLQQLRNAPAAKAMRAEVLRFAAVGAVATIVHYTLMIALKEGFGVGAVLASFLGFNLGAVVSYTLNRRFTFTSRPAFGQGLAKFLMVAAVGATINAGLVALLVRTGLHYMLAQVIATGIVFVWNFGAARFLVFRP